MDTMKIYVATHKPAKRYSYDDCYEFLHVGAANHTDDYGYLCDNSGDNISVKNPMYCELTGLYWIWKNAAKSRYVGMCHYRRYPSRHLYSLTPEKEILSSDEIIRYFTEDGYDILLPLKLKKQSTNSYCATEADLIACREYNYIENALMRFCPEYQKDLKDIFMAKEMSFGNIFVMSWENFNQYCRWCFALLFDIENDIQEKNDEVPREYGYLSEWMLNVWVAHNKLRVAYIPTIFTEQKVDMKYYLKLIKERVSPC